MATYYKLIRETREGKAVRGHIYEVHTYFNHRSGTYVQSLSPVAPTLENAECMILPLIYKVQVNLSPRFGTLMPMLTDVPGRTGIRIHGGTKPEHSQGCILITRRREYQRFVTTLLQEQNENRVIYLEMSESDDYKKMQAERKQAQKDH